MKKKILIGLMVIAIALIVAAGVIISNPTNRAARELALAERYLDEMDYENAIVEFEKVIAIDAMNVEAYIGAAKAYVGLNNYAKALEILEVGIDATGDERILKEYERISAEYENYIKKDSNENNSQDNGAVDSLTEFKDKFEPQLLAIFNSLDNSFEWNWDSMPIDYEEFNSMLGNVGSYPIVFEQEDGRCIKITESGKIFYGYLKEGKIDGEAIELMLDMESFSAFKGNYEQGTSNGEFRGFSNITTECYKYFFSMNHGKVAPEIYEERIVYNIEHVHTYTYIIGNTEDHGFIECSTCGDNVNAGEEDDQRIIESFSKINDID